jgi:uncharacterized protein YndB with AHSA1/START domain
VSRKIVKEVFVQAPPDVVWRALTDAEELTRWFPVDARVEPGAGGSIWISWGSGSEGQAPITAWEPNRHFQWTETRGPVKLAIDFHLETTGGRTVVRLVQSGFGAGADWDDEFHTVDGGWAYFMAHLRWYLERHRGIARQVTAFRERVTLSRTDALARLTGPQGFSSRGSLAAAETGAAFSDRTSAGDPLSGTVVARSSGTGQLGFTIAELNDAILFLEMEPVPDGCRAGFWLSTYGLDASQLDALRASYGTVYRQALGLGEPHPAG